MKEAVASLVRVTCGPMFNRLLVHLQYGYAPKGSSVVMYKNQEFRRFQYFVTPDWTGGIYATATTPGSRSGGKVFSGVCAHGIRSHCLVFENCKHIILQPV